MRHLVALAAAMPKLNVLSKPLGDKEGWREKAGRGCSLISSLVGWDGQIGEEYRDRQHASIEVVHQMLHLVKHTFPHFLACNAIAI